VSLDQRVLQLTPAAVTQLRRRLVEVLDEGCSYHATGGLCYGARNMANEVFGLMTDAYLYTCPGATAHAGNARSPQWIVRKAEERFLAAGARSISLADLRAAAGVGKSTLYNAFYGI
jgi:hypothetical protein